MDELRSRITYSEFDEWQVFLKEEEQRTTKIERYLARIAAEVRRGLVEHPKQVSEDDFIIRYISEDAQERMERSKAAWFAVLGIDPNKKKEKK